MPGAVDDGRTSGGGGERVGFGGGKGREQSDADQHGTVGDECVAGDEGSTRERAWDQRCGRSAETITGGADFRDDGSGKGMQSVWADRDDDVLDLAKDREKKGKDGRRSTGDDRGADCEHTSVRAG